MLAQPFFMRKAQTFPSPGFVIKVYVTLGISFSLWQSYIFVLTFPNQTVLFPQRIDENIAADDPVRIVNAVVDNLNLDNFKSFIKKRGAQLIIPK